MKTLAQILRPIAAPQFKGQRDHIYRQFKRMIANGMPRETALYHAQFSVDSLTGNYAQITVEDLHSETITLVRNVNGVVEVLAVCHPPKTARAKATLEIIGQKTKHKFNNVLQAYDEVVRTIYSKYHDCYFSDEKALAGEI